MSNPRIVLVTGASSGIGLVCAQHLASRGWRVFGASRRATAGGDFEPLAMDVDDSDSVTGAIARVLDRAGRIDAVVNNAGFGVAGAIEDTSIDEARAQFETNVFGVLRVCKAVIPQMRVQGGGHIVNVSSIAGRIAVPFQGLYCASKFAVEGLTESLRHEVVGMGIAVTLVEPGDFRTDFTAARRVTSASGATSAYAARFERALAAMARLEQAAPTPEPVAHRIAEILESTTPRLRHPVGAALERLAVWARPWIPAALHERMIRDHYDV